MNFLNRFKFPIALGVLLVISFVSCEEDLTTIGSGVIGSEPFTSSKISYDVFAFNKKVVAVPTNQLPIYQLGIFDDPIYGKTEARITSQLQLSTQNPTFGDLSQEIEDNPDASIATQIPENETIIDAFLYIPYQSNNTDTDMDGVVDKLDTAPTDPTNDSDGDNVPNNEEVQNNTDPLNKDTDGDGTNDDTDESTLGDRFARRFRIDSIYGKRNMPFNVKVEESTFFLRDLDPNTNFQEAQEYYSSQDFSPFIGEELGSVKIDSIVDSEILFEVLIDDPDTDDVDEAGTIRTKLNPGLKIPLNTAFFQQNILDKEGTSDLLTQANFSTFLRGIHVSLDPMMDEEQLLMLLDLTQANITIRYEYDKVDVNDTGTDDDEIVQEEKDFVMPLLTRTQTAVNGNAVNTFVNDAYPTEITDALDVTTEDASKIYIKGSAGVIAEINLFDENNGLEQINEIRTNNWIVNEANLVFHVNNKDEMDNIVQNSLFPPRLYLYNAETNEPLYNVSTENSVSNTPLGLYLDHDGILDESDPNDSKYKIRITDHINNMIVREEDNATLALTLTPDIRISGVVNAMFSSSVMGSNERDLSAGSVISPLGTVLFGSNPSVADDKRVKLEIFYTVAN